MRTLFAGLGFALVSVLSLAGRAAALDITTCGQIVPPGEVGVLTADLTCAVTDLLGVGVERDATLDMNGFRLSGGDNIGVHCRGRMCTILGPGSIDNGGWIAVYVEDRTRLVISDVTISGADVGILASGLQRSGTHVVASNVVIENSTQWGLSAKKITASNLTVTGNAATLWSMFGIKVKGTSIDVSNNGTVGLYVHKLKASDLTAINNGGVGVDVTLRAVLENSTLTGNDASGSGIDLRSERKPRLVGTTCGKSASPSGDWDVCTND